MPCGKIQVQTNIGGVQFSDNILNIKPDISLFKVVYRTYINFANDNIFVYFNLENRIQYNNSSTFKAKIDNIGHLLNDIYLVLEIPDIEYGITAINDLGINLIENVNFSIGGNTIHEFDNDWINIYYKRLIPYEKYLSLKKLINPEKSINPKLAYSSQRLYIWLPFNFSKDVSLGIPLLNCIYDDIFITVKTRPIRSLFTIKKNNYIVPIENDPNWELKLFMNCNVSFFDKYFLKRLNKKSREFFIEQTFILNYINITDKTLDVPILSRQILKEFFIIAQRDDNILRNVFGNYTNYENSLTKSGNYNENREYVFSDYNNYVDSLYEQYNNSFNPNILDSIQLFLNGQKRLASTNANFLKLVQPYMYGLNYQNIDDNIYYYSFSNNPFENQPNGALTLDRIQRCQLVLFLKNTPPKLVINNIINTISIQHRSKSIETIDMITNTNDTLYKYNIKIYLTMYNIIKFNRGMCHLVWPN
jgi:hypothetical protein